MNTYGKYWIDGNYNKWTKNKYTKQKAMELSKTLFGCTFCTDCVDCVNCHGCISCNGCVWCADCVHVNNQIDKVDLYFYENEPSKLN